MTRRCNALPRRLCWLIMRRCCAVLLAALAVPLFRCHVLAQFPPRCVVRVDCNRKGAAFRQLVQAEGAQAEGRSCGGSP